MLPQLHSRSPTAVERSKAAKGAQDDERTRPGFSGIYPMQYAFFARDGGLDRAAMRRQVQGCIGGGAHGVAVLGLGTEVNKLSEAERRALVDWVTEDVAGRVPVAVTVAGASVEEQAALAAHARAAGAAWLILQPPPERGLPESHYAQFFARVMERVDLPVAIQNAPEYIGVGLSDDSLLELARTRPNFVLLKGEGPALTIRRSIEALAGALRGVQRARRPGAARQPARGLRRNDPRHRHLRLPGAHLRAHARRRRGAGGAHLPGGAARHRVRHAVPRHPDLLWQAHRRLAAGARCRVRPRARSCADPFGLACARRYAASLGPLP